jgi:hypothetical protein
MLSATSTRALTPLQAAARGTNRHRVKQAGADQQHGADLAENCALALHAPPNEARPTNSSRCKQPCSIATITTKESYADARFGARYAATPDDRNTEGRFGKGP